MVKFKLKKEWILPLAFAAAAGMAALIYFSALKTQYKSMADPIKVVAAKERIAVGQTIKASQLQEISIPRQYAQPKVFTSMEKLFGANNKTVYVALSPIEKGEQILATKISKPSDLTGIANIIPEGLRAFPVNFDDKNLQILMPGSYIDVLGVFGYTDKNKLYHEIVYVIAQNILVLSVGDEFLGFAGKTDMENLPNRANVSIAVTLEQAEIIMLVKQKGVLKYAIRPAGDMDINQTKNLQVSDLIKDANAQGGSSSISQDADKSKKEIMELLSKYNK